MLRSIATFRVQGAPHAHVAHHWLPVAYRHPADEDVGLPQVCLRHCRHELVYQWMLASIDGRLLPQRAPRTLHGCAPASERARPLATGAVVTEVVQARCSAALAQRSRAVAAARRER